MPTLTFDLQPSTDPELTCFFCHKPGIDHEFHYRRDNRYRGREHIGAGVHLACTRDPTYRPEARGCRCGHEYWLYVKGRRHCANCGKELPYYPVNDGCEHPRWHRVDSGKTYCLDCKQEIPYPLKSSCTHPTWEWRRGMQRFCTKCDTDLPQDLEFERKHLPYANCGRKDCEQCRYLNEE